MDILRVLRARDNRSSRFARPFQNLHISMEQCIRAGQSIVEGEVPEANLLLLERSVVITAVTSIEVYFRDVLDFIFRYCSEDFFSAQLKALHPKKYGIDDVIDIYRHKLHPLEIVSSSQSFQSADRIEKVFSPFFGRSLWGALLELKVRFNEDPDHVATWSIDDLEGLRSTFALRHELVHDPAKRDYLTGGVVENLGKAHFVLFGCDILLSSLIEQNKSPDITDANPA